MPPIIVIGASEGGVDAIRSTMAALPKEFPAAIFVVLHIGAYQSQLPALLNFSGTLPASHATNGEVILTGKIYVAPPDHHLLIENGHMRLTRGPRENWARPAIDPLFRSAALAYGADVIGVVLTGGLNDGTAGLLEIKRHGGIAIVQEPGDAVNPSMPQSALIHVEVDHQTKLKDLPSLLKALVSAKMRLARKQSQAPTRTGKEEIMADYELQVPVAITCPDCGGALRQAEIGTLTQFRCHIGHVYTTDVVVAAQFGALEWSLAAAMRSMNERRELCRQMAHQAQAAEDVDTGAEWLAAMHEAEERIATMQQLLQKNWTHPGDIKPPSQRR